MSSAGAAPRAAVSLSSACAEASWSAPNPAADITILVTVDVATAVLSRDRTVSLGAGTEVPAPRNL